jgi:hypothetical protein
MGRPNDTPRERQLLSISTPDSDSATRADALARSISVWLPTLAEEDLRRVDALVMYFVSRRRHERDEREIEQLAGVSRIEIGLEELSQARPVVSRTRFDVNHPELVDLGGEG